MQNGIMQRLAAAEKELKAYKAGHADLIAAFVDAIEALEDEDPETAHPKGDALVSKLLRDLGKPEAANAFDAVREGWFYN